MEGSLVAFKVFTNGSTLPASDVNDFLMRQSVMTFADATARSAAITAPTEGMLTYLEDSDSYQYWDSSAWVGLVPQSPNAIINGAFDIWQRGTSFTASPAYTSDRWYFIHPTGATLTRQTSGLEGFNFSCRFQRDSGNTSTTGRSIRQNLETIESIPFQNKNVTLSFYAKAGANYSGASNALVVQLKSGTGTNQNSGSGFTGEVNVINQSVTLNSSWQRFTLSGLVPASSTQLSPVFIHVPTGTAGANDWFEITGVQLESGPAATPFRRNANSLQGELAACQRYYYRTSAASNSTSFTLAQAYSTTNALAYFSFPVTMRTNPTALEQTGTAANYGLLTANTTSNACTTVPVHDKSSVSGASVVAVSTGLVAGNASHFVSRADGAYLGWSAEL